MHEIKTRSQFRAKRKRLGISLEVLAGIADLSLTVTSFNETGRRGISEASRVKLRAALADIEEVIRAQSIPPNLRDAKWLRSEVRRLRASRARNDSATTAQDGNAL